VPEQRAALPGGGAWGAGFAPPTPGVPRLRGRAAPARAVGTGWLSLRERQEQWSVVLSALGPESVPRLQGSGSVPTWGVEGSGEHKGLQELGCWVGPGAAQFEPQWWQCHGLLGLLGAEDSLLSPGRNVGAPCVPSRPAGL